MSMSLNNFHSIVIIRLIFFAQNIGHQAKLKSHSPSVSGVEDFCSCSRTRIGSSDKAACRALAGVDKGEQPDDTSDDFRLAVGEQS